MTQYDYRGFFIQGMPKVYSCFYVGNGVLRHFLPNVYKRIKENGLSISMYATQWFMTGFTSSFPIEAALRIWDCFFYEGFKVIYRFFLAALVINSKELSVCSFERTMEIFRNFGKNLSTNSLIKAAFKLSLKHKLIDRLENDYKTSPKAKYIDWVITKR